MKIVCRECGVPRKTGGARAQCQYCYSRTGYVVEGLPVYRAAPPNGRVDLNPDITALTKAIQNITRTIGFMSVAAPDLANDLEHLRDLHTRLAGRLSRRQTEVKEKIDDGY